MKLRSMMSDRSGWRAVVLLFVLLGVTHPSAGEVYDVYILTGQSNSLGTTRFDGASPEEYGPGTDELDEDIWFYWSNVHSRNTLYPPKRYGDSGGEILTLRVQQGDGGQNPAFWGPEFGFARSIASSAANKVLIIKASRGGGGNSYWDKAVAEADQNKGHMWQHLCDTVDTALGTLAESGDRFTVKALLYVQGESNAADEAKLAGQRLESLHENLSRHIDKTYPGTATQMKLVVGEIAASQNTPARKQTTQNHFELAQSNDAVAYVATRDLPLQPDGIHFGKSAKLEIGQRMARAYSGLELIDEQRHLVAKAKQHLEAWRQAGQGDVRGQRPLVIALFTGNDTEPAPEYRQRLTRSMKHIQSFYRDEMARHGFGPLTFGLQFDDDQRLTIHVVRGDKPNAEYSGDDGKAIRQMVLEHLEKQGIDGAKQTLVIFCNLTKWDPVTRRMSHHSPYYAGGSHQAGTAWQLDSSLLDIAEIANTDQQQYLHDGQYGHISLGRYQSIFIGGICHELGHALGLPHNCERPDEKQLWGTALMGSGNSTYGQEIRDEGKGSFLTLAHAMKLASHPSFSGSVKQMRQGPRRSVKALEIQTIQQDTAVRISGEIDSDIPVYAVLVYLDPEGRSDYDATTHVMVPDDDGRFSIDCDSFAGTKGDIRLVYVHANGWAAWSMDVRWPYSRSEDGRLTIGQPSNK